MATAIITIIGRFGRRRFFYIHDHCFEAMSAALYQIRDEQRLVLACVVGLAAGVV